MSKKTRNTLLFVIGSICLIILISFVNAYSARREYEQLTQVTEPIMLYLDEDLQEYYQKISVYINTHDKNKLKEARLVESRICEYLHMAYSFNPEFTSSSVSEQYQWLTQLIDELGVSLDDIYYYASTGDKYHLLKSWDTSKRSAQSIKKNINNIVPLRVKTN